MLEYGIAASFVVGDTLSSILDFPKGALRREGVPVPATRVKLTSWRRFIRKSTCNFIFIIKSMKRFSFGATNCWAIISRVW